MDDLADAQAGLDALATAALAEVDRQGPMLQSFGKALGDYYRSLLEHGIPQTTADNLVAEYHMLYWSAQYPAARRPDPDDDESP